MPASSFSVRERAVIDSLLATIAPPQCDIVSASAALYAALERLAPHRRAKACTFLNVLTHPALSLVLARKWAPFYDLDLPRRERVLRSLADSPIAQLRTGFQAFKRLAAFSAYAAVDANGKNPLWTAIQYPGPREDRLAQGMTTTASLPLTKPSETMECDVIVVGSGAGGGVAAALFAQSGRRVVVLEAGPPASNTSLNQLEFDAFASLYLDSALTSTDDLGISLLAGSCVGGGTTVNWCTSLRLPDKIAAQWSSASGGIDFMSSMQPHYDAVSARLQIQTTNRHNANNATLLRGCRALGWHATEIPRNASACGDGCGYCGFGCAYGHKRSTAATFLRDAADADASIVANARVERILIENGRAVGVAARVEPPDAHGNAVENGRRRIHVRAETVVLAAGSLRTPAILAQSGVASPHLGRHLRLHPTTALFPLFDDPVETWHGPMQTIVCDEFGDIEDGYGAKFEAVPAHPGLAALALPWRSQAQHFQLMERARYSSGWIVLTRDRGEGSVSTDGRADIHYQVVQYDAKHMLVALGGLARICFAAGARSIVTLHTDPIVLTRQRASHGNLEAFASELQRRGVQPNRLGIFSAHQMGTCRMHRDPREGVVDESGIVHGIQNLLVADASVFPHSSGVNPMLTIMALAHRTASRYVRV